MEKTIWAVKRAGYGTDILDELLYDGWEPFATIREFQTDECMVWLRKIIRVEVTNENQ